MYQFVSAWERRFDTVIPGDCMSLSTDVRDALSKPHGLRDFSEDHPVIITLAAIAGFLAGFVLVSRYLFMVL